MCANFYMRILVMSEPPLIVGTALRASYTNNPFVGIVLRASYINM